MTQRFMAQIFLAVIMAAPLFSASIKEDVEQAISAQFPGEHQLQYERFSLDRESREEIEGIAGQRFLAKEVNGWWVIRSDSLLGLALVDNVMGKAMPITILVVFDTQGVILATEVIRYRESIGGEVSQTRWLSQFKGLSERELIHKKQRIDGISGATISVKSVHKGVKKLALLHSHLILERGNQDG